MAKRSATTEEKKELPSTASSLSLPALVRQTAWSLGSDAAATRGAPAQPFANAVELLEDAIDALQELAVALRAGHDVPLVNEDDGEDADLEGEDGFDLPDEDEGDEDAL